METEGFAIRMTNDVVHFRFRGDDGLPCEGEWRCPPDRMHEFLVGGQATPVKLTIQGGRIVSVVIGA